MERAEKARKVFFRYRDKDYSFTDCTSLVVMQELRLKQALKKVGSPVKQTFPMMS